MPFRCIVFAYPPASTPALAPALSFSFSVRLQYLFVIITGWSGQKFYVEAGSQTYNLVFSGLPILLAAVYDKDVTDASALRFPYLYEDGLQRRRLNLPLLVWWLATAVYEAALIFVFAFFGASFASFAGTTPYVFEFGDWAFTALIIVINLRLAMNVTYHTWLFDTVTFLCVAIWFPALILFTNVDSLADGSGGAIEFLFGNGGFWLWLLLIVVASQVHVYVLSAARRMFAPEYRDLVQEYEIVMSSVSEPKPSCYKRCLGMCLTRDAVRRNRSPKALLAQLDEIYPPQGEDANTVAAVAAGVPLPATPATPSTASSAAGSAASGNGAGGLLSPTPRQPLLADAGGGRVLSPAGMPASASPATPYGGGGGVKVVTARDLDVDFGPEIASLHDFHNPALDCAHRPDETRLPCREDEAEELAEWPAAQQMRVSLQMRHRQLLDEAAERQAARQPVEHPDISIRKVKIDMLRARLTALQESGLSSSADDATTATPTALVPTPRDATAVLVQPVPAGVPATAGGVGGTVIVPSGGAASAAAAPGAAPAAGVAGAAASAVAAAALGDIADIRRRYGAATGGAAAAAVRERTTLTDFSQDDRSSAVYSDMFSSAGRARTLRTRSRRPTSAGGGGGGSGSLSGGSALYSSPGGGGGGGLGTLSAGAVGVGGGAGAGAGAGSHARAATEPGRPASAGAVPSSASATVAASGVEMRRMSNTTGRVQPLTAIVEGGGSPSSAAAAPLLSAAVGSSANPTPHGSPQLSVRASSVVPSVEEGPASLSGRAGAAVGAAGGDGSGFVARSGSAGNAGSAGSAGAP